jgi:two-component system, cell cycle sensor histidine kinase and response regulator CckA
VENGFTVLEAKDGNTALDLVHSHPGPIRLLLTDVVMRGMSGPELVSAVSESHPSVKTVFMSGYTGELIAQGQPSIVKVPLLEKPFTRAALYKILDTTLG